MGNQKKQIKLAGVGAGKPEPLGAFYDGNGTNFALFSENATEVTLCLFENLDYKEELATIPVRNQTGAIWHCYLPGVKPGQLYGYRVHGENDPANGQIFNRSNILLDPYARKVFRANGEEGPFCAPIGAVAENILPLKTARPDIPWEDTVIYETHIKSFTALYPEIPEELRGTYKGFGSKPVIDYLKNMGVTAVELLPVHQSRDELQLRSRNLTNFWGYNTLSFFAPDARFAGTDDPIEEFREMVSRFHEAGMEIILDVVYNHTAESDHTGPTLSFRGIDNASYYVLDKRDKKHYRDLSGCGNALDFTKPHVIRITCDSLRYWASVMGVDGFRFDLASIMGLSKDETFSPLAPLFQAIQQDPVLNRLKMIAEPWSAVSDQSGLFPPPVSEWNKHYRDSVRRFWRGDENSVSELATRISGSEDLFGKKRLGPRAGINYVTAHDGFTLHDLVSFNKKHNEANGEKNHDGTSDEENLSWNCGEEGDTSDPRIIELRARQKRNFIATLFLSQGAPMFLGGDELGWGRGGNNNAYCQDNRLNYYDWETADKKLIEFTRRMIGLRKDYPALRRKNFFNKTDSEIRWLSANGSELAPNDWPALQTLAVLLPSKTEKEKSILILFNPLKEAVKFTLPGQFSLLMDTSKSEEMNTMKTDCYTVAEHSLAVLLSEASHEELLERLCKEAGLVKEYKNINGESVRLSNAGKISFLRTLGIEADTEKSASLSLHDIEKKRWNEILPPVHIFRASKGAPEITAHLPERLLYRPLFCEIRDEWKKEIRFRIYPKIETFRKEGEETIARVKICLPETFSPGYYSLSLEGVECSPSLMISAPDSCHPLPEKKLSGISIQLYALRSENNMGIGDFSDLMELADADTDAIALSPIHALFPSRPEHRSPYSPSSRLFFNPAHIGLSMLPEWKESKARTIFESPEFTGAIRSEKEKKIINYSFVIEKKYELLRILFEEFLEKEYRPMGRRGRLFHKFIKLAGERLEHQAAFDAGNSTDKNEILFHKYLQWCCISQLKLVNRKFRKNKKILNFDLAVGVVSDGADAQYENIFVKEASTGAPPDDFSADGQDWGLSPPHPMKMRETRYSHFIALLRASMPCGGMLRLDHVMQLSRLYWNVPSENEQGKEGGYIRYHADEFTGILALESQRRKCAIIGEDLGTVPEEFADILRSNTIYSTKVLYFEKEGENFTDPALYPYRSAAFANTHDLPTLAGFFDKSDLRKRYETGLIGETDYKQFTQKRNDDLSRLTAQLKQRGLLREHNTENNTTTENAALIEDFISSVYSLLSGASSNIVFISLHDLAADPEQPNLPGVPFAYPSWALRYNRPFKEVLKGEFAAKILSEMRRRG